MPGLSGLVIAAALLCAGFSAALALVRAQPDDFSRVRAFLSAGCELADQPCWAGIMPGRTRLDDALALLEQHSWIEGLTLSEGAGSSSARWQWSAAAPAFARGPGAEPAELWSVGGVVSYIALPTSLPYGVLEQAIGPPPRGQFEVVGSATGPSGARSAYFLAAYQQSRMIVETRFTCPSAARTLWAVPARITLFSASLMQDAPFDDYDFITWMYVAPCPR